MPAYDISSNQTQEKEEIIYTDYKEINTSSDDHFLGFIILCFIAIISALTIVPLFIS